MSALDNKKQISGVPLAWRVKPEILAEYVGQEHILGEGKLLYSAIKTLSSLILYGPPGSGKTTLAQVIANETGADFYELNAVASGVADLKALIKKAETYKKDGRRTILFIDEIHRFNKTQQSVLLPAIEKGILTFIGASTQNPYFAIIPALSSRSHILPLKSLTRENICTILNRAVVDKDKGLGLDAINIEPEVINFIALYSGGDARKALNGLELAATCKTKDNSIILTNTKKILADNGSAYDKKEDHYDTISAFIKSMRGSDADAAVYWLAKMIVAGEDPMFIARRIVICASEDVGNADPHALLVATAALNAVKNIGMPEGRILLSQATIYISLAPKSNASYLAVDNAISDIKKNKALPIPVYLKDSHSYTTEQEKENKYKYPHNYKNNFVNQKYMGTTKSFYKPTQQGFEAYLKQRMAELWS